MTAAENRKLILLVDDEPVNIRMAHEILRGLYKTRVATNGAMALETAKAIPPPDLILLDVMMPGMDGYEVCSTLKASLTTRDIPVIFVTALTDSDGEAKGFAVGAVDYIHKPFSPPVLLARVRTHLMLREAYQQLFETVLNTFVGQEPPSGTFRYETAAPLVARLKSLLEVHDGDAAPLMQHVADALAGAVDVQHLTTLRKSVDEFDFQGALEKLAEIAAECHLNLDAVPHQDQRRL